MQAPVFRNVVYSTSSPNTSARFILTSTSLARPRLTLTFMARSASRPKRTVAPPKAEYTPKAQLAEGLHSRVEAQLKRLKLVSRELRHHIAAFESEARILERVYYKGKNQHRSAVFWQRLVEIRKYATRLTDVHVDEIVERLRASFFGEAAQVKYAF
jgi:hypothetical protein